MRFFALISALLLPSFALADVLCAPRSVKVAKNGTVNIASSLVVAAVCPKNTVRILDTSVFQGPPGDQGPQGVKGDKGDKGDTGETGAQGTQGVKGDKGETGATGLRGETGLRGASGMSCVKRQLPTVTLSAVNDEPSEAYTQTLTCAPGEWLMRVEQTVTRSTSAGYQCYFTIWPNTTYYPPLVSDGAITTEMPPNIRDSAGVLNIGYQFSAQVGRNCGYDRQALGTYTQMFDNTLVCCAVE